MTTTDMADSQAAGGTVGSDQVAAALADIGAQLNRVERVVDDLGRRMESFDDLKEDLVPITHGAIQIAYRRLHELEENGTLGFVRESVKVAETVATSFTPDDVRLLGQNVVSILNTVRNLTQPQMLGVADRAATALKSEPEERFGLIRSMRDPEIRRGMALLFAVLRELGDVRVTSERAGDAQQSTPVGDGAEQAPQESDDESTNEETT
jgi:uncharacterized protein YjgD (DUF1641 family)